MMNNMKGGGMMKQVMQMQKQLKQAQKELEKWGSIGNDDWQPEMQRCETG